jgi:hypothetical protein
MPALFDLIGQLFRKRPPQGSSEEGAVEGTADEMRGPVTKSEVSEHRPWSIDRVLKELDTFQPSDLQSVLWALTPQRNMLAAALQACLPARTGKARVIAAALLLMLGDSAGREPFLQALGGPDGEARTLAISCLSYIYPSDIDLRGANGTNCPIGSGEVFAALERDLRAPWTGLSERILHIVCGKDYPQARAITLPLLSHADPALRRKIAESYLRSGRDEGAFAIVERTLRDAPPCHHHRDPGWHGFYQIKTLWYDIEKAARYGDGVLKAKAAALSMEFVAGALDAADRARRFDVNDGLVNVVIAAKVIALAMTAGGKELLERVIGAEDLTPYQRGEALLAYSSALGDAARPAILAALQEPALRRYAARALEPLLRSDNDPRDIAALNAALDGEERSDVIAAVGKALLAAGSEGQSAVERVLEHAEPWAKVELSWRIAGGTDREFADLLTDAGVMDVIDDEALEKALASGFDVRSLLWAGGERLVVFSVKSSTELKHYDLLQSLLAVARPAIAVQNLKEVVDQKVLREPVSGKPQLEKVIHLDATSKISFDYLGQTFGFDVHSQGGWHDVAGVMRGFDAFMQSIGREDRCYELRGESEWGLFVVAPASKFEPIAARLRIPIESAPERERNAAKAYQQHVQNM